MRKLLLLLLPLTLSAASPDAVILDMMTNIHENGLNPAPKINPGHGLPCGGCGKVQTPGQLQHKNSMSTS